MSTVNDSASGSSQSSGSATLLLHVPGNLSAYGSSQSGGDAQVLTYLPVGGLVDIGIWGVGGADPAMTRFLAGADTSTNGRGFIAASPPSSYITALGQLWPTAVYAAVRGTWTNTNAGAALTDVQVEAANLWNLLPVDAADYRSKLVYQTASGDAAVARVSGSALSGSWCGQMTNTGTNAWYTAGVTEQSVAVCAPGQVICGSVYLALPRAGATWTAGLSFYDSSYNLLGGTWEYTAYSTHPGSGAWQQSVAVYVAPSSAAYVAVVPHVEANAIGDGEIALMDCHRITSVSPALSMAPSTFSPARQQIITVHANRINQVLNPSFATNTTGWSFTGGGSGTAISQDSTEGVVAPGALKIVAPYTSSTTAPAVVSVNAIGTRGIALLKPGSTYTCSAYVQAAVGQPVIHLQAVVDGVAYPGTTTVTALEDTSNIVGAFVRLAVTLTLPAGGSGALQLQLLVAQGDWVARAASVTFEVDDVLVEKSPLVHDYFDGAVPSPDYLWEGTPYLSRSHYYRDYRNLQFRLGALVQQSLPLERSYQLLYAQPAT